MPRRVTALVFDFDGLVLDTESAEFQSWSRVYSDYGVALPEEKWISSIASDRFDPLGYLERLVGRVIDRHQLSATRHVYFEEVMARQKILPGVLDYIAEARALDFKIGIASNSVRSWLDDFFTRYGLTETFDVVSSRDDVATGKPDPAVYLLALQRLGTGAQNAIAFEDSPNGVLAARKAGIFCVAVPGPMTKALSFTHANLQLNSLADLSLKKLLEHHPPT